MSESEVLMAAIEAVYKSLAVAQSDLNAAYTAYEQWKLKPGDDKAKKRKLRKRKVKAKSPKHESAKTRDLFPNLDGPLPTLNKPVTENVHEQLKEKKTDKSRKKCLSKTKTKTKRKAVHG